MSSIEDIAFSRLENARPSGKRGIKATCPFHHSSKSSRTFLIDRISGHWICFHSSCELQGNLDEFLQQLGVPPSVAKELKQDRYEREKPSLAKKTLAQVNQKVHVIPDSILGAWSETPPELLEAGFTQEILDAFEVGIDHQRDRVIFPIRSYKGDLVGISGRARKEATIPRYKVYDSRRSPDGKRPDGELFGIIPECVPDNRAHLYGFHDVYADRFFEEDKTCPPLIITEGYKSTIWLRQMGFEHSVGLQGTSLTTSQKRLLQLLNGPFYIMLDLEPGKQLRGGKSWAALYIAHELSRTGKTYLCQYPENKPHRTSPDDLTKDEIAYAVSKAQTPMQILIRKNNGRV